MGRRSRWAVALLVVVGCLGSLVLAAPAPPGRPDLGPNASLHGWRPFPADNPWNQVIDRMPVDPRSDVYIRSIGLDHELHPDYGADWDGGPFGIPYVVVAGNTPRKRGRFEYASESDPGPYPIPARPPVEKGSDRHVLIIDRDHGMLYEIYHYAPRGAGFEAGSGAVFDLASNRLRPAGWTSADAAGLPIFPGLVRYDEVVEQGEIRHALRFTAPRTRRAYVHPARHMASDLTDPSLPPMGMRVRLRASYDISRFPLHAQVVLRALKRYGMFLADHGSPWFVSGAPDSRWDDGEMNTLKTVRGRDFEVVRMPPVLTR